jgi:hypothetical protein
MTLTLSRNDRDAFLHEGAVPRAARRAPASML